MPGILPRPAQSTVLAGNTVHGFLFGPLFDAAELLGPVAFIGLYPIVNGLELCGVQKRIGPLADRDRRPDLL